MPSLLVRSRVFKSSTAAQNSSWRWKWIEVENIDVDKKNWNGDIHNRWGIYPMHCFGNCKILRFQLMQNIPRNMDLLVHWPVNPGVGWEMITRLITENYLIRHSVDNSVADTNVKKRPTKKCQFYLKQIFLEKLKLCKMCWLCVPSLHSSSTYRWDVQFKLELISWWKSQKCSPCKLVDVALGRTKHPLNNEILDRNGKYVPDMLWMKYMNIALVVHVLWFYYWIL